jgi:hypothetical protein
MAYGLTQSADLEGTVPNGFSVADNALLDETLPFTIEMWVNLESAPSNDSFVLMSKSGGGANGYVFRYQDIAGTKSLNLVKAAVVDQNVNITALSLSTWTQIAAVQTSTQVEYFVDGSSVGSFSNASAYVSSGSASVFIGRVDTGVGGSNFDGKMSLVRFWQTNRSAAQIAADKCNVLGTTTNLSAEWTLDNTLNDNSGNGFTLTNINSTPFVSSVPSVCQTTPLSRSSNLLLCGVG